ncbi:hypothetical protein OHT51_11230 [Streptomyces sp. NBC_00299]
MSKAAHETSPRGTLVCPVCKQPLDMTIKRRHKTLGIFVPVWGPGPCHNPDCPDHLEQPEHSNHQDH